jgi:hypothetical protein
LNSSPADRYHRDAAFRLLVDTLYVQIENCQYTGTELREAAILAAIMFEDRRERIYYRERPDEPMIRQRLPPSEGMFGAGYGSVRVPPGWPSREEYMRDVASGRVDGIHQQSKVHVHHSHTLKGDQCQQCTVRVTEPGISALCPAVPSSPSGS